MWNRIEKEKPVRQSKWIAVPALFVWFRVYMQMETVLDYRITSSKKNATAAMPITHLMVLDFFVSVGAAVS